MFVTDLPQTRTLCLFCNCNKWDHRLASSRTLNNGDRSCFVILQFLFYFVFLLLLKIVCFICVYSSLLSILYEDPKLEKNTQVKLLAVTRRFFVYVSETWFKVAINVRRRPPNALYALFENELIGLSSSNTMTIPHMKPVGYI